MVTYTYSVSNSASSSSSSSSSYSNSHSQEERNRKAPAAYLHSVRRIPAKNVITKKSIAPMPPTPPKIYKVDRHSFRDVVQRLTAAPEFQRTRLQEVAPPMLSMPMPTPMPMSEKPTFYSSSGGGFSLSSPSTLAWCSSILLSPGTLSSLETSAVL